MMLTSAGLSLKWSGMATQTGAYTRIDPMHPLELYIGYEAIGQKSLLLISNAEPAKPPSSKSIVVTTGQRHDGKWALTFRLVRLEQEEMFMQLCCDLVEASRFQGNDATGVDFVIDRYKRWTKLMELDGGGLLSAAAQKGLLGELLFLRRVLAGGMPGVDAVAGWIGPDGADRDFVYPDGWNEVKTTGASSTRVSVSSLQQLDAPPPGYLIVFMVDRTAVGDADSLSLNDAVLGVKAMLQVSAATEMLDAKLFDAGYLPLKEYDAVRYRVSGIRRYTVDQHFPRLTVADVPSQIAAATYELSLNALEPWRSE